MTPVFDPATQSVPAIRHPVSCGSPDNPSSGREAEQLGWYKQAALMMAPRSAVIDVGAGMGTGVELMKTYGHTVFGVDPAWREIDSPVVSGEDVAAMGDNLCGYITCMDVIEHVVEDLTLLQHMLRVARRGVFVSTPNFTRSRAQNHHHCRELTIPQFLRHYQPDVLFVGAPNGRSHVTKLVQRIRPAPGREVYEIVVGPMEGERFDTQDVPETLSFAATTVDGREWPHLLGVWNRDH